MTVAEAIERVLELIDLMKANEPSYFDDSANNAIDIVRDIVLTHYKPGALDNEPTEKE